MRLLHIRDHKHQPMWVNNYWCNINKKRITLKCFLIIYNIAYDCDYILLYSLNKCLDIFCSVYSVLEFSTSWCQQTAPVQWCGPDGSVVLIRAVRSGLDRVVLELLRAGVPVNNTDHTGINLSQAFTLFHAVSRLSNWNVWNTFLLPEVKQLNMLCNWQRFTAIHMSSHKDLASKFIVVMEGWMVFMPSPFW